MTTVDIFEDLPIDEIVEQNSDSTDSTDSTETSDNVESSDTDSWPKVVSELPADAITVGDFVRHLNKVLVVAEAKRLEAADVTDLLEIATKAALVQVDYPKINAALKAKGNPLPHYILRTVTTVDGEEKQVDKIYLPKDVATEAFQTREPGKRGRAAGSGSGGGLGRAASGTPDDKALRAGKFLAKLKKEQDRLNALTARVEKMELTRQKYIGILNNVGLTLDDAVTAYENWLESNEEGSAIDDDND